jgi:cytochrome b involved in lipid metabolism
MRAFFAIGGVVVLILGLALGWTLQANTPETVVETPVVEQPVEIPTTQSPPDLDEETDIGSILPEIPSMPTTPVETKPSTPVTPTPIEPTGITPEELATHNTTKDCWVGYKGIAYDVTKYLPKHPGGSSRIAKYCGTEDGFTNAFSKQHGTRMESRLTKEAPNMGALA